MKDNTILATNRDNNSSFAEDKILIRFLKLKYRETITQILKYFCVSLVAALADFTLFMVLFELLEVWYIAANTAGFVIGVYINYTLSTIFVFKGQSSKTWVEFIIFTIIGIVGLAVSNATLYATIDILGLTSGISKIIAICSAFFWNFFVRKFILFNRRK